jgi:putative oxidoreductase
MNQLSLLFLRVFFGLLMCFAHGWPKLMSFAEYSTQFPDPIGFGSTVALSLTIFAEVVCALAVAFGLLTRLATIPLMITMLVAAFVIHAQDPFQKQEFALVFFGAYFAIFLAGSGQYSLQSMLGLTSSSRSRVVAFFLK